MEPLPPTDVTVAIPTLNEADAIQPVINDIKATGYTDIVVLDGGSTDTTQSVAHAAGADVWEQSGTGKGQALREFKSDLAARSEYIVMLDGDGTYHADDLPRLLEPFARDSPDVDRVLGNRFADITWGGNAMPALNYIGNKMINAVFAVFHGVHHGDLLTGYQAFTADLLEAITIESDGFTVEAELGARCATGDWTTEVVGIRYSERLGGEPKLHPGRDGAAILRRVIRDGVAGTV